MLRTAFIFGKEYNFNERLIEMSNHSIGNGMNKVLSKIMELYDSNKIDHESVMKILCSMVEVIAEEDGNDYEAFECIYRHRCGKCLKKMKSKEPLYNLYYIVDSDVFDYRLRFTLGRASSKFATSSLCTECFDEVVNEYAGDVNSCKVLRKYIQDNNDESDWQAE